MGVISADLTVDKKDITTSGITECMSLALQGPIVTSVTNGGTQKVPKIF
jgi:hypothetical protein